MLGYYNMEKTWNKFAVGKVSSKKNFDNPNCVPFSFISHVSHLHHAISILKKNYLSAGLVFDKSILNNERILVNWLSPNHWANGFRYGNVRFNFPLNQIITDKNYFWVESVAYGVAACRILITNNNYDFLQKYDPTLGDGPWFYDKINRKNYYNGNYCLEFMYEGNLEITDETKIDFVDHHSSWCADNRNNPTNCENLGLHATKAGAHFISKMISSSIPTINNYFFEEDKPSVNFEAACSYYLSKFNKFKKDINGKLRYNDLKSISFARALFNSYANQKEDEFKIFTTYFKSVDDVMKASIILICNHFNIKDWEDFYIKL
jgi:hypothetical protein